MAGGKKSRNTAPKKRIAVRTKTARKRASPKRTAVKKSAKKKTAKKKVARKKVATRKPVRKSKPAPSHADPLRAAALYGASTVLLIPAVVKKEVQYDAAWARSQAALRNALPVARVALRHHRRRLQWQGRNWCPGIGRGTCSSARKKSRKPK